MLYYNTSHTPLRTVLFTSLWGGFKIYTKLGPETSPQINHTF